MVSAKWVEETSADLPVAEAARRVLGVRLKRVRDCLGAVLQEPDREPEQVHQLRVGTRRARAALDIFAECLSAKRYRRARKQLRSLRRAAGAARDWDVFLQTLCASTPTAGSRARRAGLDFLLGLAAGQRLSAQQNMVLQLPEVRRLDQLRASVLRGLRAPELGPATLLELACPNLRQLLDELDQAVAQDLGIDAHLHQVRIVGKRLRYAMEVFACCFGEEFRAQHYVAIEQMQEILGRAHDSQVACARLEQVRGHVEQLLPSEWKRYCGGFEALRHYHEQRLPEERQHFEDWWQRWQKMGGKTALLAMLRLPGE